MPPKAEQINGLLTRGIQQILPSREALKRELEGGKKLTVYLGIDPTAPYLHLGHSITLFVLKRFQKLGHKVVLLMGDFTARIGDPSGKTTQRKPQSKKEVLDNLKAYKDQAGKIINIKKAKIAFNSRWLGKLTVEEFLEIASLFTTQQMITRDMFQERMKKDLPIGLHEFLYPLLQGYDSVALKTDVEVGGSDQLFNMLIGRDLVKKHLGKEKFVVTTKLLIDPTSGAKMSKSEGNLVALSDSLNDMYAKVMAFPDELVGDCLELCTEVPMNQIEEITKMPPRESKARLAREITSIYYDEKAAKEAEAEFERVFSAHEAPSEMPEIKISQKSINVVDLLLQADLVVSKSEARRLIEQGGVRIDGRVKTDPNEQIIPQNDMLVSVGKRKFAKLKVKS